DKGWDARKRAYCLKIQPATGSFARNLIYSTKPGSKRSWRRQHEGHKDCRKLVFHNFSFIHRMDNTYA
ncbi:hypothetical protein KVP94_19015, partial [Escherichia coli]|nr:hypothetical protein [Escherichia coli]